MFEAVQEQFSAVTAAFIAYIPQFAGGLALLCLGWLLARLLRLLAGRILTTLNRVLDRMLSGATLDFVRISPAATKLLSSVLYWITILIFGAMAVRVLGLTGAAVWLETLVTYVPAAAAGVAIIVAALILGNIIKNIVTHAAASADLGRAPLYGHIARSATFAIGLVIGLDQVGLDVTFLIILLGIGLAAILLGFALAFALGARDLIKNLIATQHLKLFVNPGQVARIGGLQGRILEFAPTGLVLETSEGKSLVPGSLCMVETVTVITSGVVDDQP